MKIKEAAALCGLTEKAIRLYEEKGLISPTMTEKNGRMFRDYDGETVTRLQTIAILRKSFFSLDQIAQILDHPETIPTVFSAYRAELHRQYTDLKPLITRAGEIDAETLTDAAAVSDALTAPAPHGIADEVLPHVHFRVWDEGASTDERERAYARYQKWIVRWERRYTAELAVREFVSRAWKWKWIVFAILPFALVFWYFYAQPIVRDVRVTLHGYELVYAENFAFRSHERIHEFDSFDVFRDTVIDTLPAPIKTVPHTLTLDGKWYHYLLNPHAADYYEGVLRVDGFAIDTGDLNGIRSGGTLTAEEAEEVFGDTFKIWENNGSILGSRIHIGTHITIKYARAEDGCILHSLYYYESDDTHRDAVILKSGYEDKSIYFVFPAQNENDADRLYKQTFWAQFQENFWNGFNTNREEE